MSAKERNDRYREKHKEEIKERDRLYRESHKEQIAEKSKRNYANQKRGICKDCGIQTCAEKHSLCKLCYQKQLKKDRIGLAPISKATKEEKDEYFKRYNDSHKKEIFIKGLKHRLLHKDEIKNKNKMYRNEHNENYKVYCSNRRAKIYGSCGNHTPKEWEDLKKSYMYRCVYCGVETANLTQDHIVPIKNGGDNSIENIVPACGLCNSKKGAKSLINFMYSQHLLGFMIYYPVA